MNENLKILHCNRRRRKKRTRLAVYLLFATLLAAVAHWQYAASLRQDSAILSLSLRLDALERQNVEILRSLEPMTGKDDAQIEPKLCKPRGTPPHSVLYQEPLTQRK